MTASEDPELGAILSGRLSALVAPDRWSIAAVGVSGSRTGWWLSDAVRSSAFHIGSVTKTITALALAVAGVDGRVALDDPLGDHLAPAARGDVQLVDLATHTAGYPRLPRRLILRSMRCPRDPYSCVTDRSVDHALARLSRRYSLRHWPYPYTYSNFGYGVVGRALATERGDSFFGTVRAAVLDPLGLQETTPDIGPGPGRIAGHDATGRVVPDWHNAALAGCGSLWSTIEDLHRYLVANLYPERTPIADAIRLAQTERAAAGAGRQVALGWLVSATKRGATHWHNGGTSGFGTFVGFNRTDGVGVAVLTSRAHSDDLDHAAMSALVDLGEARDGSGRLGA